MSEKFKMNPHVGEFNEREQEKSEALVKLRAEFKRLTQAGGDENLEEAKAVELLIKEVDAGKPPREALARIGF